LWWHGGPGAAVRAVVTVGAVCKLGAGTAVAAAAAARVEAVVEAKVPRKQRD